MQSVSYPSACGVDEFSIVGIRGCARARQNLSHIIRVSKHLEPMMIVVVKGILPHRLCTHLEQANNNVQDSCFKIT